MLDTSLPFIGRAFEFLQIDVNETIAAKATLMCMH